MIRRSVEELTAAAERIVTGRVVALQSHYNADCTSIVTDLTLEVEAALKGPSTAKLSLTLPGGQVGDTAIAAGGIPYFLPGERVLLFLNEAPQVGLRLTGLWQGKFSLVGDEALQPETRERHRLETLRGRIEESLQRPVELAPDGQVFAAPFVTGANRWGTANMPVPYFVNTATSGANRPGSGAPSGADLARLVYESQQRWQSLPNAFNAARFAGTTSRDGQDHADGSSDLVHGLEPAQNDPGTLAVNICRYFTTTGLNVECDTQIDNDNVPWSATDPPSAGRMSLRSVVTHELGHFWGLRHTNLSCPSRDASRPLLCPSIATGEVLDIRADDQDGIASLYPLSGSPPTAPGGLTASAAQAQAAGRPPRPPSAAAAQPQAAEDKVGREVLAALEVQPEARVVVALAEPPSLRATAVAVQALRDDVARTQDAVLVGLDPSDFKLTYRYQAVPALVGRVSEAGLRKLMADPNVIKIDVDMGGRGTLANTVPLINADDWHALGITGEGIPVAVLDTGLDTDHLDLADDLVFQTCFLDMDGAINGVGACPNGSDRQTGTGAAEDGVGHGTGTSGVITSRGTVAARGVAHGAEIVAIKVLDNSPPAGSFANFSEVVAALDFILTSRPEVRVINMSFGTNALFTGNCDSVASVTVAGAAAINALRSRSPNPVIAFAASGNDGSSTQMSVPACLSNVVSVGATNNSDQVASFTNSNSTLDLMAPGVNVTMPGLGNTTQTASGTSFASPHAAGCAALLLDNNASLTPAQIETQMKASPIRVTDPRNGLTFPRLDCSPAQVSPTPTPTATPTPTPSPTPTPTPRITSVSLFWGNVANELYYEAWRASGGCTAAFTAVGTTAGDVTTFVDDDFGAGLAAGTYCYRVRAGGQGGDSPFSGNVLVTAGATPTPTPTPTPTTPTPTPTARPPVSLVAGFNFLVSPVSGPLPAVLTNIQAQVRAVFFFNTATQSWLWFFSTAPAGVNNLTALVNGQIYFFLMASPVTWQPGP